MGKLARGFAHDGQENGHVNDVTDLPTASSLPAGKRARGLAHGWADCRNGIVKMIGNRTVRSSLPRANSLDVCT